LAVSARRLTDTSSSAWAWATDGNTDIASHRITDTSRIGFRPNNTRLLFLIDQSIGRIRSACSQISALAVRANVSERKRYFCCLAFPPRSRQRKKKQPSELRANFQVIESLYLSQVLVV
jgi:hypothetical protein